MSKYKQVKNDFFDDIHKVWCIDAWKTDDDNEEGVVVAYVTAEGDVHFNDLSSINDELVREKIEERVFLCICDCVVKELKIDFSIDYLLANFETDSYIDYGIYKTEVLGEPVYFAIDVKSMKLAKDDMGGFFIEKSLSEIQNTVQSLNGISTSRDYEKNEETLKMDWIHSIINEFTSKVFEKLYVSEENVEDTVKENVSEKCFQYLCDKTL